MMALGMTAELAERVERSVGVAGDRDRNCTGEDGRNTLLRWPPDHAQVRASVYFRSSRSMTARFGYV